MSHVLDPSPCHKLSHLPGSPSSLERDVLYGRPPRDRYQRYMAKVRRSVLKPYIDITCIMLSINRLCFISKFSFKGLLYAGIVHPGDRLIYLTDNLLNAIRGRRRRFLMVGDTSADNLSTHRSCQTNVPKYFVEFFMFCIISL